MHTNTQSFSVAIIGMNGRFPGARTVAEFWRRLCAGEETISSLGGDTKNPPPTGSAHGGNGPVAAGGRLEDADLFAASFFGFNPREAEITDPQHRILLECAWQAMEDAGYDAGSYPGPIGVFVSASPGWYGQRLYSDPTLMNVLGGMQVMLGNSDHFLATRISYKLNLKGPSVSVQTACSSSLVAVHMACQSLLSGECDMAMAGGVGLPLLAFSAVDDWSSLDSEGGGIVAGDGHCRAFDATAQGTVPGEGAGIVVLRRLSDAIADGDFIHAVILGSAVNNDGALKAGYTAPSVEGQARAIAEAMAMSHVEPETITYVEAHGTATPIGDPIEVEALTRAFGAGSGNKKFCALASVKTNIGHLDAAAGVAGLIKAVLALEHRQIPASLHFTRPNPKIDFANSPFYVNRELTVWAPAPGPRRAGVNAFGFGGTNAHVVLEEAPPREPSGAARPWNVWVLSAKTKASLEQGTKNLADHLENSTDVNHADAAYTLQVGRKAFAHRKMFTSRTREDTLATLGGAGPLRVFSGYAESRYRPVRFLFPGQGAQYANMARELYESEPRFRQEVDFCATFLLPHLGLDLRKLIYPDTEESAEADERLKQTAATQPALFVIEYSLAQLWMEWGIHPQSMAGHSIGEYVAARLAGVLSLEDALSLVAARGQLIQSLPPGAMLAVPLAEPQAIQWLGPELSLASVSGPSACVIAGSCPAIHQLKLQLAGQNIEARLLATSHAFHSWMMAPILPLFAERMSHVRLQPPRIPYVSNVTGKWITAEQATDPNYWVRHLREPVRIGDGIAELANDPDAILLEVGPGRTLSSLVRGNDGSAAAGRIVASSLRHPRERCSDQEFILKSLGKLWVAGVDVDWQGFHRYEKRYRVPLPVYPFERQRYWIEPATPGFAGSTVGVATPFEPGNNVRSEQESVQSQHSRPELEVAFVAPRNEIERKVSGIWEAVLGFQGIGVYDNFFDLGGHSLIAIQVISRLRAVYGLEVSTEVLFNGQTVAALSEAIADLQLVRRDTSPPAAARRIPRAASRQGISAAQVFPVSFAQRRLWFLEQLHPGTGLFNIPTTVRVGGPLDPQILRESLATIVHRHEILRTRFEIQNGQPVQVVEPTMELSFSITHLDEAESQREHRARELARQEAFRPFDLSRGPLFRALLVQLGPQEHLLTLNMHHAIGDAWSIGVLWDELGKAYQAAQSGTASPLPDMEIQYGDYAAWQREFMSGPVLEEQLAYWKKQLQGGQMVLQLPIDHPRLPAQSSRWAQHLLRLPQALAEGLKALSRREGTTLFMTMLAALEVLLARYSGQDNFVVGISTSNRDREEIEALIGLFVNSLALKADLSGAPAFRELLARVRETSLGGYAHQDLPFEYLVDELQLQRDLSRTPVFQVMFDLHNTPTPSWEFGGLKVAEEDIDFASTEFDLVVTAGEDGGGPFVRAEYSQDLFEADTMARMMTHYVIVLQSVVADPELRVWELPLLTESEEKQLSERNRTQVDRPEKRTHQLFEEQAERTPDATAVVMDGQRVSYRELNRRANHLAHHLRRIGVRPEVIVGICLERSVEMIVGLLGIWKAGGAYVPLDPDYPADRLAFILEDAHAHAVLTHQKTYDRVPSSSVKRLCLDRDWQETASYPAGNPGFPTPAEGLAYVIYTSGSTGRPKGVAVTHRGLENYLHWSIGAYLRGEQHGSPVHSPLSFDLTVTSLFPALLSGRAVILLPHEQEMNALAEGLASGETFALVKLTPSHLRVLRELTAHAPSLNGSACFVIGGEALTWADLSYWQDRAPGTRLINEYGPTETVVGCCVFEAGGAGTGQAVPIGRPIANTAIHILDDNLRPVPVGVAGELYIGGAGLARGYLNRPDLTAEKFVPNPYSGEPGSRLYRSGDRARQLISGDVEYLGRLDEQVKIRGHRIEPEEIEAVLRRNPAVGTAAVIVREDRPGEKRLVAYIVPRDTLNHNELRSYLKAQLPEYMVPSQFLRLNQLPLTTNGKVDRRALPAPETSSAAREDAYVGPRTAAEELLCRIWEEVLGLERVGVHDNFFESGGDSILSILVVARASRAGLRITPRQIFQHQTIAELALAAPQGGAFAAEQGMVRGPAPLTAIQQWFFEQSLEGRNHFNQAVLLESGERLDATSLKGSIAALLRQHDALRLRFRQGECGPWRQHHDDQEDVERVFARVELNTWAELPSAADQWQSSLDLARGPLARVVLFEAGEKREQRLLLVIHHLVVDGVSWRILLDDLERGYTQLKRGGKVELGCKTTSFQEWARKVEMYSQTEKVRQEIGYWQAALAGEVKALPRDLGQGSGTAGSELTLTTSFDIGQTRRLLLEIPRISQAHIQEILLAALGQSLCEWMGEKSVLLDLEGHGREDIGSDLDVTRTVGWFTSIFPVRLDFEDPGSCLAVLKKVKEQLRGIPNHGIGYGLLRYMTRDADVQSQLGSHPCAELIFNYMGQFDWAEESADLFRMSAEPCGAQRSLGGKRKYLLEINAVIEQGRLRVDWNYSSGVHRQETVENLAGIFRRRLEELMTACETAGTKVYTTSDFPLVSLEQRALDLLAESGGRIEDVYPLTPMQEGMLFHTLLAPGTGVYFEQASYLLEGTVNVEALASAWQLTVDRNQSLRSRFAWDAMERPVQVVEDRVRVNLERQDWRALEEPQQQAQFHAFLANERKHGFDLKRAPLMRLALLQMKDQAHWLVWSYHHILLDGWSVPIVLQEMFANYAALSQGGEPKPVEAASYRDYVRWLQQQDMEKAEEFWRKRLKGFSAPTELGLVKLTNAETGTDFAEEILQLPASLVEACESWVRRQQLTLNTVMQGMWSVLLSRYSGEPDVVFGATVSGRSGSVAGIERLVGVMINTLPVRVTVSERTELVLWLRKIQEQQIEQQQYEYTPLVKIQEWSDVPAGTALFSSILIFENYPGETMLRDQVRSTGLQVTKSVWNEQANYPLALIVDSGDGLALRVAYDRAQYDAATMRRLLGHYRTLLESAATTPIPALSELRLLTVEEETELSQWSRAETDYPRGKLVHELFEDQVQRTPDAVAVMCEGQELGYLELNQRANQLAHYLRSIGVGPEWLVGICLPRSLDIAVSLLGILKAGGAYVPLDPTYPPQRLAFMLRDAELKVLLTQHSLLERLPETGTKRVCLDTQWSTIARHSNTNPKPLGDLENLVYVIYTSGSTGQPKGAGITHRGAVNLAMAQIEAFNIEVGNRVLQFSSLSFDASFSEWATALLSGASLVIAERETLLAEANLLRILEDSRISVVTLPPSALATLPPVPLADLHTLVVAGEPCPAELLARWAQGRRMLNAYGPTEVTVCATISSPLNAGGGCPIGRPMANVRLYVLDAEMRLVPAGLAGELYVSGPGLARGYLNRPELTAQRFVCNPFSTTPGERMYRTGDVVRWDATGVLEFIGRADEQVKLRGFRIELGEIETVLGEHPAVRASVVVAREDTPGEKRLVGYAVLGEEAAASGADLRNYLQQKLPGYMVPSVVALLPKLPLNANGKVDKRALPAPETERPRLRQDYVAPQTALEQTLAHLWGRVLAIERVGAQDSFFELGGHSMSAISLIARINESIHTQLSLRTIFDYPVLADLARYIKLNSQDPAHVERVAELTMRVRKMSQEERNQALRRMREEQSSHESITSH